MKHRSFLLIAVVLFVVSCTGTSSDTTATTAPTTAVPSTETTSTEPPATTSTTLDLPVRPDGIEALSPEMQQEILDLIAVTEEIRGLRFLQPPIIVVVTPEELAERVRASISEEIGDVPADEALLKVLGLLDPEVDLLQLYLDLYGEQVAGYYDGDVGELVVPAGDSFSELQKATLVHELVHALTDQRFGFNDTYESLIDEQRFDEAVAFLAVIEGDATLTEVQYIQRLSLESQQALLAELFGTDSPVFDSVPEFLQNSLVFPYEQGLVFVQRAFEIGGFDEVNRLYVEPPVSSEQIIEPRDYQRDMPVEVSVVPPALSGYEVVFESVWGELGFALMFDQVLGGADAAVSGWGGDAYVQWFDGTDAALLLTYRGDEPSDLDEMYEALVAYASTMAVDGSEDFAGGILFEGDDFAFVRVTGDSVTFVAAGTPVTGRQIVASLP
ncbi:MAG: hypothetical protein R3246_00620 [Acidimicrobiia bacterium]|nr:hypothetical protein [Acidimicrobiia bacterium]